MKVHAVPTPKFHKASPLWNSCDNLAGMCLESLYFSICEVVLIKIGNLLKQLKTLFWNCLVFVFDIKNLCTVIEQQGRKCSCYSTVRIERLMKHLKERFVRFVSPNIENGHPCGNAGVHGYEALTNTSLADGEQVRVRYAAGRWTEI